jgi:hypothetical protein
LNQTQGLLVVIAVQRLLAPGDDSGDFRRRGLPGDGQGRAEQQRTGELPNSIHSACTFLVKTSQLKTKQSIPSGFVFLTNIYYEVETDESL